MHGMLTEIRLGRVIWVTIPVLASCGAATPSPNSSPPPFMTSPLPGCTPAPCATYMGVALLVDRVEKNFAPAPNGFHYARVTVSYRDTSGEHQTGPGYELALRDAVGVWQRTGNWLVGDTPQGCIGPVSGPPDETLAPGGSAGPYGICFKVGGDAQASLLLAWEPSQLTRNSELNNDCMKRNVPNSYVPRPPGVVFRSNIESCIGFLLTF